MSDPVVLANGQSSETSIRPGTLLGSLPGSAYNVPQQLTFAQVSNVMIGNTVATVNDLKTNGWTEYYKSQADVLYQSISNTLTRIASVANSAGALTNDGSGNFSYQTISDITVASTIPTTSGTSVQQTGISTSAKRVHLDLAGVSLSGTSNMTIKIGPSSGVVSSGYTGSSRQFNSTNGIASSAALSSSIIVTVGGASDVLEGTVTFHLVDSATNKWSFVMHIANAGGFTFVAEGYIALAGSFDRIQIASANGTDTFDAGTMTVSWET